MPNELVANRLIDAPGFQVELLSKTETVFSTTQSPGGYYISHT
jgi:hypothetical protein